MLTKNLTNPKVGDNYFWKKENIRIAVVEIYINEYTKVVESVSYFKNGELYTIKGNYFPHLILSMSEDYETQNVLEEY